MLFQNNTEVAFDYPSHIIFKLEEERNIKVNFRKLIINHKAVFVPKDVLCMAWNGAGTSFSIGAPLLREVNHPL